MSNENKPDPTPPEPPPEEIIDENGDTWVRADRVAGRPPPSPEDLWRGYLEHLARQERN